MFQHSLKSKHLEQTKQDHKNQLLSKKKSKKLQLQKEKLPQKEENKKKQRRQLLLIQMNRNSSQNLFICKETSFKHFQIIFL